MRPLLIALATWLLLSTSAVSQQRLNIVADEWPPFSSAELPNGGISLDVIATVFERAGYETSTKILPWQRIMSGAKKQEFDVVGSLFFDAELEQYLTYGDPFYSTEVRFVRKTGTDKQFTNLESLRPYAIAVGDGFLYEENFDRADYLSKIVVTTALQGVQMVAYGRADLTLDSVEVINFAIQDDDPELATMVEFLPKPLTTHNLHMAVRKNLPDRARVVSDFNRVLAEMKRDGSLEALLRRHRD